MVPALVRLLERKTGTPQTAPLDRALGPSADEERALVCRFCGHAITSSRERIEVAGSHTHTRLNPANVVFHFGCFRHAPGAAVSGAPSAEHTWFEGLRWRYAHCGRCAAHLGWEFSGAEAFYGLVLDRLGVT
jgi:hypothetical protein